jgi:hypothetical protein
MIKYIFFVIVSFGWISLNAQNLNIGIKFQKTHSLYWENGVSVQYSFSNIKPDQLYLGFDFISSRLGSALNSNALSQDSYIASATWLFRKDKSLRITTKLNFGYLKVDLEEEAFSDLPQTATLLSPEIGFAYDLHNLPLRLNLGLGFNIGLQPEGESPGTLQPLFYNFSVYYQLK